MEAAVRFSQNSRPGQHNQHFLKIDVAGRVLQVYNVKAEHKNRLDYDLVYASNKLSPFRAFDWHPTEATLVAVGHTGGEASLVNLADNDQTPLTFAPRTPRSCHAVALNTLNWLAVGSDKARTDYCLNVWDINQFPDGSGGKSYSKNSSEPLHKLASGEYVTSLRFFQDQPKLVAAAVKGQFIRLYDLREPTSTFALQFGTRCVNNIAIDIQDEHYFASCLPSNTPTVSIWDRRMVTRTSLAHTGFGNFVNQIDQHPEVSVELKNVIDQQGQIWGLRFSKTHRGCLGVLSSTGQLRVLNFNSDHNESPQNQVEESHESASTWDQSQPTGVYLDSSVDFTHAFWESPTVKETKRVVSFDFTTARTRNGQPRLITLTGEGKICLRSVSRPVSPQSMLARASLLSTRENILVNESNTEFYSAQIDPSEQAVKRKPKLLRNPAGYSSSLTQYQQRCKAGYLFDVEKNLATVKGTESQEGFWNWLKHARQISMNDALIHGGIDFSFIGVFGFWMEEIDFKNRSVVSSSAIGKQNLSIILRDLARRVNLSRGKGCPTEYPHNRSLCLYAAGLPWIFHEVEKACKALVTDDEHIKAAATALFAGEIKLAQRALRARGSNQSHKMLAMALAGAQNRRQSQNAAHALKRSDEESDSEDDQEDEWEASVSAISEDLTDPYAKAILAYVKTGHWKDVLTQSSLPLQYRINIALRHFDDSELTRFLSQTKQNIIAEGNLEGVILTGLGTKESVELLAKYARITADIQTAALGLSFAAASDCFLPLESTYTRTVQCIREAYKYQLLSCGLKFDKAQFDVMLARQIREKNPHMGSTHIRQREQIRLICSHCSQSLAHFGHERQASEQSGHVSEISKNSMAPEKAARTGTICPRCGRHLPRCGVCELWLGTPDETFSKWYKPSGIEKQRNSGSVDLSKSLMGSTITAIGPNEATPSISITKMPDTGMGKSLGQLEPTSSAEGGTAIEIVDESVTDREKEKRWYESMHKFTVFCTKCSHGFHAEHARMWFHGVGGQEGHRVCPVPMCECICNG